MTSARFGLMAWVAAALLTASTVAAGWKMVDFRNRLHAITVNEQWEAKLSSAGAYSAGRPIVLFGDSEIWNWPMAESFGSLPIYNRGLWGDWASKSVERFRQQVLPLRPSVVLIEIGTNDIGHAVPAEKIIASIDEMTVLAQAQGAHVVICSLLPVRDEYIANHPLETIVHVNAMLQQLSRRRGAEYVDLHSRLVNQDGELRQEFAEDGLHLNRDGYLKVTGVVWPTLFALSPPGIEIHRAKLQ